MGDQTDFERIDRPWTAQPPPVPNDGPSLHIGAAAALTRLGLLDVARDMIDRGQYGLRKYQSLLQAGNGRDWRADLYEEVLDGMAYCRQGHEEDDPAAWPMFEVLAALAGQLRGELQTPVAKAVQT